MSYFYLFSHCRLVQGFVNDAIFDLFQDRLLWINNPICRQALRALQRGKSIEETFQEKDVDFTQISRFLDLLVAMDYGSYQPRAIYSEKFRPFVLRSQEEKNVLHRPLARLVVELSSSCSLSCSFCGFKDGFATALCACGVWPDPSNNIKLNMSKLLSEVAANGCQAVVVQGGDPFLQREHLHALVQMATQKGTPVSVHAPGVGLTEEDWVLINKHGVKLIVPVFGFDRETHDRIAGMRGAFEELSDVFNRFQAHYLKALEARVILTSSNADQRQRIVQMLDDYGVQVSVESYIPFEALSCENNGSTHDLLERSLKQSFRDFRVPIGIFFRLAKGHECWQDQLAVTLNGDIVPCLPARSHVIGSAVSESLLDILRLKRHYRYRDASRDSLATCSGCEFRYACRSCSLATEQLVGSWQERSWQCRYDSTTGKWNPQIDPW